MAHTHLPRLQLDYILVSACLTGMQQTLVDGSTQLTDQMLLEVGMLEAIAYVMNCCQAVWVVNLCFHLRC